MKTLLISGSTPPPEPLRDVVERGSTVLHERKAAEVDSDAAPIEGLNPNELFIWPRDEDRLTMAFMTGA